MITREWAKDSLIRYANEYETICEKLRQIYDILHNIPENPIKNRIVEMLVDALIMGKKMQERLEHYKDNYNQDGTGNNGKNLKPIANYKEVQEYRSARIVDGL
jgi:hypothetical protein